MLAGTTLTLRLIEPDQAAALYADPYIARVGTDHRPAGPIRHPLASYVGAFVGERLAGAFLAVRHSPMEVEAHALLKRDAIRHSRDLGRKFLAWCFSDSAVQRVTAHIVEHLQSAVNYCLRLGFKREGLRRDACLIGGLVQGVHMLGLTRSDWEATWAS